MDRQDRRYEEYLKILKEEMVPATGCTEPIAVAYCAATARAALGELPERVLVQVSGNMIKNAKSVVVPNTGGLKGVPAAAAAGIIGGKEACGLEVIAGLTEDEQRKIREYLERTEVTVQSLNTSRILDLMITVYGKGGHYSRVRISDAHSNIVLIETDKKTVLRKTTSGKPADLEERQTSLSLEGILDFANTVKLADVEPIIQRQIDCNLAIAREGLKGDYGASVGKIIMKTCGKRVADLARAAAAAGSDARMSGCEMPVVINSGSGNQGLAVSVPVIIYAQRQENGKERLFRALVLSNLIAIYLKTGIGRLSAYCGAVSAGAAAGAGIAYLNGGDYRVIAGTLTNALATASGMICDGAKPSCAAKIAQAVEAGILGYEMCEEGKAFLDGDGIVGHDAEQTIARVGRLAKKGMKETDREIIRMMVE